MEKSLYDEIESIRLLTHYINRNKITLEPSEKKTFGAKKGHKGYFFRFPKQFDRIIHSKLIKCPYCNCKKLETKEIKKYFSRDLIMSKKTISSKDIRYLVHQYYCKKCNSYVYKMPKRIIQNSPYGLGMFVYCTFQRIALSMPYSKISSEIKHLFSTNISIVAPRIFLNRMAVENQEAYDNLLNKIKRSGVIYADETRWPIQGVKWWVWIFTSEKEAVYTLSEKRDYKVPSDLLNEYKGVLVCDFYSAYEKVKCKQQKCLVHVLRDFQKALKKAPYDNELKNFIEDFIKIFKPIFSELRTKNPDYSLIKSKKGEIRKKLKVLIKKEVLSQNVNKFKKRFKKHLESMIRFLSNPERISWNNNKAERDLRPLCVQRKISGTMRGKKDSRLYLQLFSIFQTCEKRDINFMRFLFSRRNKIPKKAIKSLKK